MRPIYKSVVLESAILAVSLSLQAEINDGSDVTTVGVDASTLDGLRVELASPKVSGALDLIASGAAVVSGSTISVTLGGFEELATLEQVTYRLTVKARYGTQVRTLYALDITVPRGTLAAGTQEYEDSFAVVSTFGDGGGEFPDDYARQGDDPNATNTAIYEAMQGLTGLEPDVAAGKIALAAAITAKGVQSSSDETLQQMAVDVQQITQAPVVIDGGEMYAKQLFGSLTTPNYWNLYEVMTQLLSDGRFENYGGILLAEYYKGYDSLALSGAGAGGGYYTSDGDYYQADVTHTWHDANDGKGNRWVAYLFAAENHDFDITNTNTCPRSIFIGRKVGVITSLVAGRVSEIVVQDGSELADFISHSTQNFGRRVVMHNIKSHDTTYPLILDSAQTESAYVQVGGFSGSLYERRGGVFTTGSASQLRALIVDLSSDVVSCPCSIFETTGSATFNMALLIVRGATTYQGGIVYENVKYTAIDTISIDIKNLGALYSYSALLHRANDLKKVYLHSVEQITQGYVFEDCEPEYLYIGYSDNDKTKPLIIRCRTITKSVTTDIELKEGYCKTLDISQLTDALTEANMYTHILQRLKQDEADCGDGVTITLGATNLAKLTSQESVDLLDALTNTYGYTFA